VAAHEATRLFAKRALYTFLAALALQARDVVARAREARHELAITSLEVARIDGCIAHRLRNLEGFAYFVIALSKRWKNAPIFCVG
jgi:hypothetical protein